MPHVWKHGKVAIILTVVGVILGILVSGRTSNPALGIFVTFCNTILGLFIDILRHQADLAWEFAPPLIKDYTEVKKKNDPLFTKLALHKYEETEKFFKDLQADRVVLTNSPAVQEVQRFLHHNLGHGRVHVTSYREFKEWESEAGKEFLRRQGKAISDNGLQVRRIFILDSEEEKEQHRDILDQHREAGVEVKTVLASKVHKNDLPKVRNCAILYDSKGKAVYCGQADHTREEEFEKGILYRDEAHIAELERAYKRVNT